MGGRGGAGCATTQEGRESDGPEAAAGGESGESLAVIRGDGAD